jgi:soluble lytic murein transglycosylase
VLTLALAACGLMGAAAPSAHAADGGIMDAREAWRVKDKARLTALRDALVADRHPLAPWADHWLMQLRMGEVSVAEVDDYLARWGTAYVADRTRNDWLLELGRRRDWANFLRVQSGFRMNDDREVQCYSLLARKQLGQPMEAAGDLREQARQAWLAQKDADVGCDAMAQALFSAGVLTQADVWRKLRIVLDNGQPRAVTQVARMLGDNSSQAVARLMGAPQRYLQEDGAGPAAAPQVPGATAETTAPKGQARPKASNKRKARKGDIGRAPIPPAPSVPADHVGPLNLLALQRWAAIDPQAAAAALSVEGNARRWKLSREDQAWAWASMGRVAAGRLSFDALTYYDKAMVLSELNDPPALWARHWAPDTLAWMIRVAVRGATGGQGNQWPMVDFAFDAMPPELKADPAWMYWKGRAGMGQAASNSVADPRRMAGRDWLARVVSPNHFYGLLAYEDLNAQPMKAPNRLARPGSDEMDQARANPGLDRALRLYELGWRSEGAREWNYSLSFAKPGGMSDRELIAAAELACDKEIWDRCINTSERTRQEFDLATRFPTPFRREIAAAAKDVGLDAAYMIGLIRQESRFQVAVRSSVGASGLMQVMPATAQWTAKKLGMSDYTGDQITDRDINLKIGAGYLKLVLDDFGGSQAMAAAAYNAGPGRPRKWREGARVEAAAWAENVPFNETRDYVKKVLYNGALYGHVLQGKPLAIKPRLGPAIGPKVGGQAPDNTDLP